MNPVETVRQLWRRRQASVDALANEPEPPLPVADGLGDLQLDVVDKANPRWSHTMRNRRITFVRAPVVKRSSKIFTMGSCFAIEIRHALLARGYDVFPKYKEITFDPASQRLAKLPDWDNVNHYDTFTIRQEFDLAFSGRHYLSSDFLKHTHLVRNTFDVGGQYTWQDPYRKQIYAANEAALVDLSGRIDKCIGDAIALCDVYVITLGLTEVWRNEANGLYFAQPPGVDKGGGFANVSFHRSTFQENYDNMRRVCELVFGRYPDRTIVLTVSPVPLNRTSTENDVIVATTESKSILRAVAGQLEREFERVHYWPSYEISQRIDIFEENGRHVSRSGVGVIVDAFLRTHAELDPVQAAAQ